MVPDHPSCVDALRLSAMDRKRLLKQLETAGESYRGVNNRNSNRVPYDVDAGIVLLLIHPGGSVGQYLVRPRNISRNGIGFLHGNYLHPDSACRIHLRTREGETVWVNGRVRRCRHVEGRVHEIGMQFDEPVDPSLFAESCVPTDPTVEQSTELPRFNVRLLHVESLPDDQELLNFHLTRLGVEVVLAPNGLEALQRAAAAAFDMVITGLSLPGLSGLELTEALRAKGFAKPILVLTADGTEKTCQAALAKGVTAVLTKPLNFDHLIHVLAEHCPPAEADAPGQTDPSAADGDALLSEHWSDTQMRPLIMRFIDRLEGVVASLVKQVEDDPAGETAQKLALDLKGAAGGYGYPALSESAAALHQALADATEPAAVSQALTQIQSLTRAVCATRNELSQAG